MIKSLAIATLLAAGVIAAPAAAVSTTSDAFTTFNATQGAGGFTYGSYGAGGFTAYMVSGSCLFANSICLSTTAGGLPIANKASIASQQLTTVNVPNDRLLFHPGSGDEAAYVGFTATTDGSFTSTATFSVQGTDASGVDLYRYFTTVGGVTTTTLVGSLALGSLPLTVTYGSAISIGDTIGYFVDKQGVYGGDSTGVNFAVTTSIPEPATWSLMIAGFALVGVGMRLTRQAATTCLKEV